MSLSVMRTPQATKPNPKDLWVHRSKEIEDVYRLIFQMPSMDHPQLKRKSGSELSCLILRAIPWVKELLDAVILEEEENWGMMKSQYEPGYELYYPPEICLLREKVEKKIDVINRHLRSLELPMIGE